MMVNVGVGRLASHHGTVLTLHTPAHTRQGAMITGQESRASSDRTCRVQNRKRIDLVNACSLGPSEQTAGQVGQEHPTVDHAAIPIPRQGAGRKWMHTTFPPFL